MLREPEQDDDDPIPDQPKVVIHEIINVTRNKG